MQAWGQQGFVWGDGRGERRVQSLSVGAKCESEGVVVERGVAFFFHVLKAANPLAFV